MCARSSRSSISTTPRGQPPRATPTLDRHDEQDPPGGDVGGGVHRRLPTRASADSERLVAG
jgi:hypothetical protein